MQQMYVDLADDLWSKTIGKVWALHDDADFIEMLEFDAYETRTEKAASVRQGGGQRRVGCNVAALI